jgi:sulfite reductase (NADPH) flavoprotein alpha-component
MVEDGVRVSAGDVSPIVAYGSTRCGSERIAKTIAGSLGVAAVALNDLGVCRLEDAELAIFVVSTIGNGSFPRNAERFAQEFEFTDVDLRNLRFALLALGSSVYKDYCHAGDLLYKMLTDHGAVPMVPYSRSDKAARDLGVAAIEKFVRDATSRLTKAKKENAIQFTMTPAEAIDPPPNKFQRVPIVERELLSAPGYSPRLTKLRIQLPPGVTYKPGDQVNILPENYPELVSQVITKLYSPGTVKVVDPLGLSAIPPKVTIGALFSKYLDLSAPVPPKLAAFGRVDNPASKSVGRFLLDELNRQIVYATDLIEVLPEIEPRTYSIASDCPGAADLIVGDVFVEPNRLGLSTGHLSRPTTRELAVQFVDGDFVCPEDPMTPILLVALGSGIAPLFSVIEHRAAGGFGACFVIYGLRVKEAAPIVTQRLEQYKANGVIDECWCAISRGEERLHVNDIIKANSDRIWEIWANMDAALFYCGPVAGYDTVKDALVDLSMRNGKGTRFSAVSFTTRHKITVEAY